MERKHEHIPIVKVTESTCIVHVHVCVHVVVSIDVHMIVCMDTVHVEQGIWEDVEKSKSLMQSQLLASLRASIQLPACLRVVGFLRRMESFTPTELRLRFLQARDTWLTSVLCAIPRDDRKLTLWSLGDVCIYFEHFLPYIHVYTCIYICVECFIKLVCIVIVCVCGV